MLDGIIMADLHFGAINPRRFMKELDGCLFTMMNHLKKLDVFIIAGDLFDMKEYSSSDTFRTVLDFLYKVIEYTSKLDTKIIILKGTRNHDDLQLYTLEKIFMGFDRIKFIHSVSEDTINGASFLYIPEEYIVDQELYYKDYFDKHYDIMIGHGMIDKIWYAKDSKRASMSSAPVFDVEKLCSVANYCYFGHIHEHKEYGKSKRFRYVGPMTVWEYDKHDCGFYMIHYDEINKTMSEEYIENDYAQLLKSYPISVGDDMTMDELMKKVQNALDRTDYDGLKLIVRIKSSHPLYVQAKNYLITKVGLYDKVTLSLITDEDRVETEEEKILREKDDKLHDALFSNPISDDIIISEFIKSKENKNISLDRIRDVCGIEKTN